MLNKKVDSKISLRKFSLPKEICKKDKEKKDGFTVLPNCTELYQPLRNCANETVPICTHTCTNMNTNFYQYFMYQTIPNCFMLVFIFCDKAPFGI